MTIIVAEDHVEIRTAVCDFLRRLGHQVEGAGDGEEALTLQHKSAAQALITDIFMPKKDGIQTIIEFRKWFPETKIIAMSGGGTILGEDGLVVAKRTGADITLVKPFAMSELVEALARLS